MGFNGLVESSSILEAFKKILSSYDKKCTTVYALADQVTGLEMCEKDLFKLPEEALSRLEANIKSKIMDELNSLILIIQELEEHELSMKNVVNRMEGNCQKALDKGNNNAVEFGHLQTIYAIFNYLQTIVAMKKFHFEMMSADDVQSIVRARKNTQSKDIEKKLEVFAVALSSSH